MKRIALAIFLMANCLAAYAQQAVILFGPIASQEAWVQFEAKLREFKLVSADNQVDMARVLPALHLDMAENNPAALQALPKDMHEPAGFVANMGRFGLQPKMTLAALKEGVLNQQFKFVVAGAAVPSETKPAPVAPAAPAAVAAASAPKVVPPQATPPAVDQALVIKQLEERFDQQWTNFNDRLNAVKRGEDEVAAASAAATRSVEAANAATTLAGRVVLSAEAAASAAASAKKDLASAQAAAMASAQAASAAADLADVATGVVGRVDSLTSKTNWILGLVVVGIALAVALVFYRTSTKRTLKVTGAAIKKQVETASQPILEKAQTAETAAREAHGVAQAFAAQVTKNQNDIGVQQKALSGLLGQVNEVRARLEVAEDILGIDPKWTLDRLVRQAIFDTCFDLEEGQSVVLPIRLTAEVTRHLRVTRAPGEKVFVGGLSQQSEQNAVKITELGCIITRAYHQKTFRGVEPQMALAA